MCQSGHVDKMNRLTNTFYLCVCNSSVIQHVVDKGMLASMLIPV